MRPKQAGTKKAAGGSIAKEKLIRLDDLIPERTVKGGRQSIFGATESDADRKSEPEIEKNEGDRSAPKVPKLR
jgi:hypothetical protein